MKLKKLQYHVLQSVVMPAGHLQNHADTVWRSKKY